MILSCYIFGWRMEICIAKGDLDSDFDILHILGYQKDRSIPLVVMFKYLQIIPNYISFEKVAS